jgi:hypothetical protein
MRKKKLILSTVLVMLAILVVAVPVLAAYATFGFEGCVDDTTNPTNIATGESQLRMTVSDEGVNADQAKFIFWNTGPNASSITDIYFADGTLLGIASINGGPGVDFDEGARPVELPGRNRCDPVFPTSDEVTKYFFSFDSNNPTQPNGVNPGEVLEITFNLINGMTFDHVVAALANGTLRVGLHIQGFANGGSEAFHNEGFTAIQLASFDAKAGRGKVSLNWATGTEINNAGFNLYRASSESGAKVKVNGDLIAALAAATDGASYRSVDAPGYGTFYYWLEDVGSNGISTMHGPVKVTVAPAFRAPAYRPVLPGN